MPEKVREAMQLQVEAERRKRASVLESEGAEVQRRFLLEKLWKCFFFLILGVRQADINIAEGKKRARILTSEAYKMEQVNRASGESNAIQVKAEAQAEAIKRVADALETKVPAKPFQYFSFDLNCSLLVVDGLQNGHNAVSVSVAEKYIHAFEQLAKEGNTLILPSNAGDISHMVAQVRNFSYEQAYR